MHTQQRLAAHEFLETQEALSTKAAHIELYGVLFHMAQDPHLKDILYNQQRRMIEGYDYGVQLLQGHGVQVPAAQPHTPQLRMYEQPNVGLHNPQSQAPNPNTTQLSDATISTIALSMHKSGSALCMLMANECVNQPFRMYHATSANVCQEMSWEMFQYMNYRGYYQTPQLADQTMNTMLQGMGGQAQPQQAYQTHFN